jgi:poly(A) polymerase
MHPSLDAIRTATSGTSFDGDLWIVGGAVRDQLLGIPHAYDFDLVTRGSSAELARFLFDKGMSTIPPVTYERFGTAMVRVHGADIEIVTARRESYSERSRKPMVEPAGYDEDAARRDFTINTLMLGLHSGELKDPLGIGSADLEQRILRTPLDPDATFRDDPLRMLRAVRFRRRFALSPADGLLDSIRRSSARLEIISGERIRDELVKILAHPTAPDALSDLMDLGLLAQIAPEFLPMVGCEQGKYHHLDVWEHTLLVLKNCGSEDLILSLGALLHDVGKPPTRRIDEAGNTRFFSHEVVGAEIARVMLRRLRFSQRDIDRVAALVKNHMRLGSAPVFTASAARRVIRDLGDQTDRLLRLVEADTLALRPGVKVMELAVIRAQLAKVEQVTPRATLESPLNGSEIIALTGLEPGAEIGRLKAALTERVLDGEMLPDDKAKAAELILELAGLDRAKARRPCAD